MGTWIAQAQAGSTPNLVIVDKATHTLRLMEVLPPGPRMGTPGTAQSPSAPDVQNTAGGLLREVMQMHTTVGKVRGDKEMEGDQKTPEGIYSLASKILPPRLQPKFGAMAFLLNYPNEYDRLAGRTGSHIMLHSTNTPDRLNQNYDSEGCIVVNDEQIHALDRQIRVGLTPILIYEKLTPEYLRAEPDAGLVAFFKKWLASWETKDLDRYIELYHSEFKNQGMNKTQWRTYKAGLAKKYASIQITASDVLYLKHPKYSVVMFTQHYKSTFSGGRTAFDSTGTKLLYVAEEDGQPRVITEAYSNLRW